MLRILFLAACVLAVALILSPVLALVVYYDHCDPISHIGACAMGTHGGDWLYVYQDMPRPTTDGGRAYNHRYDPGVDIVLDRIELRIPCPRCVPV